MMEQIDAVLYRLRFVIVGLLIMASIFLLAVLITGVSSVSAEAGSSAAPADPTIASMSDSPNAVSNLAGSIATSLDADLTSFSDTLTHGLGVVVTVSSHTGTYLSRGSKTVLSAAGSAATGAGHFIGTAVAGVGRGMAAAGAFTGHVIGSSIIFVLRIPLNLLGFVSNAPGVSTVIQPSEQEAVPVINPQSPELAAARKALPATAAVNPGAATPPAPAAIWPIHGSITTLFGVPEPPYEAIHTGLDISDGARAGVTPVKAYRAGTVKDVLYGGGLGNHVIIDHGNGVTSVYGHLSSITVSVGQVVDTTTTVGYEGSTGVSTGPHLHFEIRVNGQATDPHQFIPGQPYD